MAYSDAEDKIIENIENGVDRVKYADGREVQYITNSQLLEKINSLKSSESSPFIKVGLSGRSI